MTKTWQLQKGHLTTRWAREMSPETVHPEYPRPQMVRDAWQNLNGLWDYALRPISDAQPDAYDGAILVPFPVESALSGVMVSANDKKLWYRRTFSVPPAWREGCVLLHLDWEATVWVNGHEVGTHRGGYDPFSFDISEALSEGKEQEITVSVWDPTDEGVQPFGKQTRDPHGIWYVSTTGIWQTVWLEPVPQSAIERLKLTPDVGAGAHVLNVICHDADGLTVRALALDGGARVAEITGNVGETLTLPVPDAKLWSPESPFLYDLQVTLLRDGAPVDEVTSYFGMRGVSLRQVEGQARICLNDEPVFQYGPLDQGFWPDGLYTPPTDAALRYDLEVTKNLGFTCSENTSRSSRPACTTTPTGWACSFGRTCRAATRGSAPAKARSRARPSQRRSSSWS